MFQKAIASDIDIAHEATMLPIGQVAQRLGLSDDDLEHHGKYKAKIAFEVLDRLQSAPMGKLVLVSAITPTPAGEGKTTTVVGLVDALNRLGKRCAACLREPSLGPCFGIKGGAAGGGHAQVVPMEDINLHFTGDFHAIGAAHNLLSAVVDNHIHHGNALNIDPRRVTWKRVVDMNDRALRQVIIGLGGPYNAMPRESGFDITVASEVMAIFCLSESLAELEQRLERIVIGYRFDRTPVTAADLKVHRAMAVLLRDALKPNLVQTLENNPAFVHGGPFANIAHGCNSVIATKLALRTCDFVVTEAGFGADLGAEKFLNIKCRQSGLRPSAVVLVATVRALKMHGGVALADLAEPNAAAVAAGVENLQKHIENIGQFGLPVIVAINAFTTDTQEEIDVIEDRCTSLGASVHQANHWADGGAGAEDLARAVISAAASGSGEFTFIYPDDMTLYEKVRTIARKIYGADDITAERRVREKFAKLEADGFGTLPVCIAKTQYSFSADPVLKGRPHGFNVSIRDVTVSAGAGFVVVYTGDIMTVPGLPRVPAAESIGLDERGQVVGLF